MARSTSTNYSAPSFPKATVDADPFDANDVQQLAEAVDVHDHTTGKGVVLTARANLLTNGGFEVWQRGNGPFITGNYSADRWMVEQGASDTHSVSRDTTNVDSAMGSRVSAACTVTRGGSGSTQLSQLLSGSEYDLKNRVVSASVRVRTSTASAVRLAVYDGSGYQYSSFHTGGSTWQTLTVTATMTAGAGFAQIAVNFQASCTAYIDNAMLVVGSVAADYAPLHPADDLARCQRYYEVHGGTAGNTFIHGFYASSGAQVFQINEPFKVTKAVVPTMTKVGTWGVTNAGQPTASDGSVMTYTFGYSATGTGACQAYSNGTGTYITAESNP